MCGQWLEYPDDFAKTKGHVRKDGTGKRCYRRWCKLCWSIKQTAYQRGKPQYKAYQRRYYLKHQKTHNDYKKKPAYITEHRAKYYGTEGIRRELPQLNRII